MMLCGSRRLASYCKGRLGSSSSSPEKPVGMGDLGAFGPLGQAFYADGAGRDITIRFSSSTNKVVVIGSVRVEIAV